MKCIKFLFIGPLIVLSVEPLSSHSSFLTFCVWFTFSLSAGTVPFLLVTRCHGDTTNSSNAEERTKDNQFERMWDRMSFFFFSFTACSSGSKSQQVQDESSRSERSQGHCGNLDEGSCEMTTVLLHPYLSLPLFHSKIALCSHEYFIFILLKISVLFVLGLLCILMRDSFPLLKTENSSLGFSGSDVEWGWGMKWEWQTWSAESNLL